MRRVALHVVLVGFLVGGAGASRALAQTPSRVYVEAGVSEQLTTHDITAAQTFPLYAESATVTGTVSVPKTIRFDAGGGVRVAGPLRVGVLVSGFTHDGTATATYTLPDPFLFDTPHSGSGSAPAKRRELAIHIQLAVAVVDRSGWQVIVAGGPTVVQLQQQLPTQAVIDSYTFPFQTVTTAPGAETSSGHGVGGHVECSVVRAFARKAGVYGDVRFSSAKATVTGSAGTQKIDAGGVTVGGGLRIGF
jgi:hypothetical protein